MDLTTFLAQSPVFPDMTCVDEFASEWKPKSVSKGAYLIRQEQPEKGEYILLDGSMVGSICDQEGKEVCVGFYVSPFVVTPNIARTRDGLSLVSISATTDASLVRIDTDRLTSLMISSQPVRDWANGILRAALSEKAEREWCLAALGGAERLAWFRQAFPVHEAIFAHTLIASFLGVTPVTLSRLRSNDRQQ